MFETLLFRICINAEEIPLLRLKVGLVGEPTTLLLGSISSWVFVLM